ncbi:phenol hydroxylase subunit [Acinetobacter sichuanensis]|uniref:Phenol hydroxylase n=1 Tax=Acinetobacter sichuanensis TaxID=2136183 RepID=A0A371YRE9_9GAMM|nr:phenol hydroxylase subunit [Acinetobacter sichuanensis]RFC83904.1 phenol hydroxylase [Acinetobacter sichuanensis]
MLNDATPPPVCFVHVTGTQNNKFVEFEFSIGDPDLSVELIMPFDAFEEFCTQHNVQKLSASEQAKIEFDRMKWRYGQPGIKE